MNTPSETRVSIAKLDAKKQIAYGVVYLPYVPDSQGDFMTPEEIERVAHNFLKKGAVDCVDTEHNLIKNGSAVVESFVSRPGDPDFPVPGSWVLGVHIPDKDHWAKAERGEIGGFSMYGTGRRQQRIVEIEVPDDGVLFGKTEASSGNGAHDHAFALDFDAKGTFLGGETDEVNGHAHLIKKGTVTEPGPDGHRHRFSFVDTLAKGCSGMTKEQKKWKKIRENMKKGDFPGHPFRGNQYTAGTNPRGGPIRGQRIDHDTPIYPHLVAESAFAQFDTAPHPDSPEGQKLVKDFTKWANAQYRTDKKFRNNVLSEADDGNAGRDFLHAKAVQWFRDRINKGDFPGHPFRGNQYVDGEGGGASISDGNPLGAGGGGGGGYTVEAVKDPFVPGGNMYRVKAPEGGYVPSKANPEFPRAFLSEEKAAAYAQRLDRERQSAAAPKAASPETKQVELTRSGHRPLATIAREIRRDWGPKVNFGAKPYLSALASLHDIKDNYGMDSAKSVVAYFLSNASGWRGPKAKEIKAELKKIIGIKKEDMDADDLPETDGEQEEERCKDCQTPKACGKAGRCLLEYEKEESEDEDEEEEAE